MKQYIVLASVFTPNIDKLEELKRFSRVFGNIKQNVSDAVIPVVGCFEGVVEQSMAFEVDDIDAVKQVCHLFDGYGQKCILVGNRKTRDAFMLSSDGQIKWCGKFRISLDKPAGDFTLTNYNGVDAYITVER